MCSIIKKVALTNKKSVVFEVVWNVLLEVVFLAFVNGAQALYVYPGLLKFISVIIFSPANEIFSLVFYLVLTC